MTTNNSIFIRDTDLITGSLNINNESIENMIKKLVEEEVRDEVLLQMNPNLYLFSILKEDENKLQLNKLKRAKDILERKGIKNVNS